MEIAFLVIAVIGLLALTSGGGGISGGLQVSPNIIGHNPDGSPILSPTAFQGGGGAVAPAPVYVPGASPSPGPTTWTPAPAPGFQPPMVPSTQSNTTGQLIKGGAAIGTAALPLTHLGLVVPIVGAAVAVVAAIAIALYEAHEKRLTDAKNENAAVDQWLPVFDSFVTSVVNAYNTKQIDAYSAASICQQFDQTLYTKFRSFVGQPGTAWSDQNGMAGRCDKTCTVGCCVYFGDLGPVLNNISYVLGYPTGKWGKGDPRISGRTIIVPKIYPSKYSSYTRAQYSITLS